MALETSRDSSPKLPVIQEFTTLTLDRHDLTVSISDLSESDAIIID